jgi:hypothetical protein
VSLLELEAQMGFPRDYLDFTIWYLRNKKLIKQGDNAALSLTCEGVDFVEENFSKLPLLGKLLSQGQAPMSGTRAHEDARERRADPEDSAQRLYLVGNVAAESRP